MKNEINVSKYKEIFENIKQEILKSQYKAMQAVNKELIYMYWHIGKIILSNSEWGNKFIDNLSMDLKLEFGAAKNDVVKEGSTDYIVGSYSNLKMTKSKLGPKFSNIPCYVDVRNGGTIDEVKSLFMYLQNNDYIKTGAWQKFDDIIDFVEERFDSKVNKEQLDNLRGNSRANDLLNTMREDVDLVDLMQVFLIEKICDIYPAHSLVTNDFRQELINRCNYFTDKNINVRNVNEVEELDKSFKQMMVKQLDSCSRKVNINSLLSQKNKC